VLEDKTLEEAVEEAIERQTASDTPSCVAKKRLLTKLAAARESLMAAISTALGLPGQDE